MPIEGHWPARIRPGEPRTASTQKKHYIPRESKPIKTTYGCAERYDFAEQQIIDLFKRVKPKVDIPRWAAAAWAEFHLGSKQMGEWTHIPYWKEKEPAQKLLDDLWAKWPGEAPRLVPKAISRSKYIGNWQPGDFAIYSDFGLRSLYIVRILPWPEDKGDRFTEQGVTHDRLMGSVHAEVVDSSMVDWDMKGKRPLYEWQQEGSIHYYDYTNLYRNIDELIEKEKRTIYPEVLVRILYDLRRHPGWLMLAAYGLRNKDKSDKPGHLPQTITREVS